MCNHENVAAAVENGLLFSFVVPVYAAQEHLSACVDSLRRQTYSNLEIILVDDGSPDQCPALCDAYAGQDTRIRVIHKKNGGATSARKAGAQAAIGQYICCVDSDDHVAPDYLEKMAQAAGKDLPDLICCGAYMGVAGRYNPVPMNNRYGYYGREEIEREIFPQLIQTTGASYFAPAYWAKAIKRELFQRQINGLNEQLKIGEDGACIIVCIYEADSLCILPDCLYYYCDNPDSLTKNRKAFRWDGPALIAQHLQNNLDLSQFDFQQQWYRKITHELFTVVKSQFDRPEPYRVITADIKQHLQEPVYYQAIENSQFEGLSGKLAQFALKHHLFALIWAFHKLKR